jgi:predicted nucleic acid-binding protein
MAPIKSANAGKVVAFDTAPLIYYLEEHPEYISLADELFETINRREARGLTSILTLLKIMVKPLREGKDDIADSYRRILNNAANLSLYEMNKAVCVRAARLRAAYDWMRTPDAIQLATALEYGAEIVVTNDGKWKRISELTVLVLKDYLPASP